MKDKIPKDADSIQKKMTLATVSQISDNQQSMALDLNSNLFEDVKLIFDTGENLLAHCLVLSAASPVLRVLLQTKSLAKSELVNVLLPNFDFNITRQLLKLIYTGEVSLENGQLSLVIEYGRLLDLPAFREDTKRELLKKGGEFNEEQDKGHLSKKKGEECFVNEAKFELHESEELASTEKGFKDSKEATGKGTNEDLHAIENAKGKDNEDNVNDLEEDPLKTSCLTDILFSKIPETSEPGKKCPKCDYRTKWMGDLKKHIMAKHEGLRHGCDKCDAKFTANKSLRNHKLTKHEGLSFPCKTCNYTALNIHQLKHHEQSKHEGVRYQCKQCEEKFIHRCSLKKHTMAQHLGVRFTCQYCEDEFLRKDYFSAHIKKCQQVGDVREVNFPCPQCEEKFKNRSTLKEHNLVKHPRVKLSCHHCEQKFKKQYNLSLHIRKSHEKRKIEEGRFVCTHCKETYRFRQSLRQHTLSRHQGLRYNCEYCAEDFSRQSNLKAHIKRCH